MLYKSNAQTERKSIESKTDLRYKSNAKTERNSNSNFLSMFTKDTRLNIRLHIIQKRTSNPYLNNKTGLSGKKKKITEEKK